LLREPIAYAAVVPVEPADEGLAVQDLVVGDRKSTRLNSSHVAISYAVFCLKKKKNITIISNLANGDNYLVINILDIFLSSLFTQTSTILQTHCIVNPTSNNKNSIHLVHYTD